MRFCPLPEGTTVETAIAELTAIGEKHNSSDDWAMELVEHCSEMPSNSALAFSQCMDWAVQLRMGGMDWGDAIHAAMILYFG